MAAPPMDRYAPLKAHTLALVGMMGVGKSSVGRRVAAALDMPFYDADAEVERAAGRSINDIFADLGEPAFREGERRVISRLLDGPPHILATGGGAFMNAETRERVKELGISVWLKAEPDVLMRRVRKRSNRPLLQTADPEATLRRMLAEREPVYALADLTILSSDEPHEVVVGETIAALGGYLGLAGGEATS